MSTKVDAAAPQRIHPSTSNSKTLAAQPLRQWLGIVFDERYQRC